MDEDINVSDKQEKKSLKEKLLSREVVTYLIAGLMTTVVNMIAKFIFKNLIGFDENVTTALSWCVAVTFAYLVNNYWVFLKGNEGAGKETAKIFKFVLARIGTYFIEAGSIYFLITLKHVDGILGIIPSLLDKINASPSADNIKFWLVQLPVQFVVVVLNYVFSKLFIFSDKKDNEKETDTETK